MLVKTSVLVGQYFTDDNNESKGRLKAIFEMEDHLGNIVTKYRLNYIPGVDVVVSEDKFLSTYKKTKDYLPKGTIVEAVYNRGGYKCLRYANGKGRLTQELHLDGTPQDKYHSVRVVEKPKQL